MNSKQKYLVFFGLIALCFLLRIFSLWTPLINVDESQFAEYANKLLSGGLPFVASVDTKPMGIYWFFAAVFAVFGKNNMIAVHVATILCVLGTSYYIFKISKSLSSETSGILAALFYIVFSTCYIPKFISTSIVLIMMLPLTASMWYAVKGERSQKQVHLFFSGILFGLACLFKYQAGINLFVLAVYFLIIRPFSFKTSYNPFRQKGFFSFLFGGSLVGLAFLAHLLSLGIWDDFLFYSYQGNSAYISAGSQFFTFLKKAFIRGGSFILATFLLWYFGVKRIFASLRNFSSSEPHSSAEYLILVWFFFSLVAVSAGGRFYDHYFLQVLPALCILASLEAEKFFDVLKAKTWPVQKRKRAYSFFLCALLLPPILASGARLVADDIYRLAKDDHPHLYIPLAKYVDEHTAKTDTIFVWGFATPIYFYSNREAASRFLWCDWMTGRISGNPHQGDKHFEETSLLAEKSWGYLFEDLEQFKPVYFIDTAPGNYHDYGKFPIQKYPQLVQYLEEKYRFETELNGAHFYRRKKEI